MAEAPAPATDNEQQPEPVVLGVETAAEPVAAAAEAVETAPSAPEMPPAPELASEPAEPEALAATPTEPTPTAAAPATDGPSVAGTLEVPASPQTTGASSSDQEGGEWDLLVWKLRQWITDGQLQAQWQAARTPLSLLAGLIALLLVLRVYSAVLNVLDSVPLLPGLLELAGLVTVVQFSLTRLVRSEDRREVISGLRQRWQSFRGRG